MDEPLRTAAELWRIPEIGGDLRLVGGLAIRLHAGAASRVTRDVDVVAMSEHALQRLLETLRAAGWQAADTGAWWRASAHGRPLIDIARHPVVSPRTFDEIPLRQAPVEFDVAGTKVLAASREDLAVLKLVAHRDQDLVDLLLLASLGLDSAAIEESAASADIERRVAEGAMRARSASKQGELAELAEEVTGEPVSRPALIALDQLLADLERRGL